MTSNVNFNCQLNDDANNNIKAGYLFNWNNVKCVKAITKIKRKKKLQ